MSERGKRRSGTWFYVVAGILIAVGAWAMLRPGSDDEAPLPVENPPSQTATIEGQQSGKAAADAAVAAAPAAPALQPTGQPDADRQAAANQGAESPQQAPPAGADQAHPGATPSQAGATTAHEPAAQPAAAVTASEPPAAPGAAAARNEPGSGENQSAAAAPVAVAATAKPATPQVAAKPATPPVAVPKAALASNDQPQATAADHKTADQPAKPDQYAKLARKARSARQFLLLARDQLQSGSTKDALDALERAETRALNRNSAAQPVDANNLVGQIQRARAYISFGNKEGALRSIAAAMQAPAPTTTTARHASP